MTKAPRLVEEGLTHHKHLTINLRHKDKTQPQHRYHTQIRVENQPDRETKTIRDEINESRRVESSRYDMM